jgi:hypothetical protein
LMGRAGPGEILCDAAIRQRDRIHSYISLGAVQAKGYTAPVPIYQPDFSSANDRSPARSPIAAAGMLLSTSCCVHVTSDVGSLSPKKEDVSHVYGRRREIMDIFTFLFKSSVVEEFDSLAQTFWVPSFVEVVTPSCVHNVESFPVLPHVRGKIRRSNTNASTNSLDSSREKGSGFVGYRFSVSVPSKKVAIFASTGMGKSFLIDLFEVKINALIAKNHGCYNIKIFRHQFGYINSTTLFSAWFCIVRQLLHAIAEAVAEQESEEFRKICKLVVWSEADTKFMLQRISLYLPEKLRSYVSILSLVGVNTNASKPAGENMVSPRTSLKIANMSVTFAATSVVRLPPMLKLNNVCSDGEDEIDDMLVDSDKTDFSETLDATEKLRLCGEIVVALFQLHVTLTHKLTIVIMYAIGFTFYFYFYFLFPINFLLLLLFFCALQGRCSGT